MPSAAIDSLETERITADSADQRAGRAARLGPGSARRLWDARDRLRPHREPEIHRVDLSATVLDVMAWGGDPRTFEWFERPRDEAVEAALTLLDRLGAVEASAVDGRRPSPSTHAAASAPGPHARRSRRRDVDGASLCAPLGAPCAGATRDPGAGDHLGPLVRGRSMVERPAPRPARCTRDRADRDACVRGEPFVVRVGVPPGRARRLPRSRGAAAGAPVTSCPPCVGRGRRCRAGKRRDRGRVPRRPGRSLVELCRLSRPRSPESGHLECQHSSCEPCRTRVARAQRDRSCASTRSRHRHRQGDGVHPLRRSCPH